MQPPQSRKEVQKLTSQIASLNWFISKLVVKLTLLFHTEGSAKIEWGTQ
jgi:hypothetical protein